MSLDKFTDQMLPAIEDELGMAVATADGALFSNLHTMLSYHLGWEGEGAGPKTRGKRIRPLLVLLTTAAAGGEWRQALPAVAAVELIHNFSLIHDDIQDNSPLRRGRSTVWKNWGIPQAINAGDTMFAQAHLALTRLVESASPAVALRAIAILPETTIRLTQGQYLDLAYEHRQDLSIEDYWPMIAGKTAALISACTSLGAIVAEQDSTIVAAYKEFGHLLGLAFQVRDDILGIWGDAALTGKSTASDLEAKKKSLPVLFGLAQKGPFASRWAQGPINPKEVRSIAFQLESEGGRAYAEEQTSRLTQQAQEALSQAKPQGEPGDALRELAAQLVERAN